MTSIQIFGVDTGGVRAHFGSLNTAELSIIRAEDIPVVGNELDGAALARIIRQLRPDVAIVEAVAARPGQGVSSMFKFGQGYGIILGVLAACGVPTYRTPPTRWKKHFGLGSDKEQSRARAIALWPTSDAFSRKKDHGRAEAALIARFGAEVLVRGPAS